MSVIKGLRAATARSPTIRKAVTVGALAASGGLAAGEDVQSVARKLSAVDRCIEVLSDSMAKLPNFVIDNRSREHVPHDILYLLNVRPNEAMTPAIRKKVLETSRLEGGNGYDWIIRRARHSSTTLRIIKTAASPAACWKQRPISVATQRTSAAAY